MGIADETLAEIQGYARQGKTPEEMAGLMDMQMPYVKFLVDVAMRNGDGTQFYDAIDYKPFRQKRQSNLTLLAEIRSYAEQGRTRMEIADLTGKSYGTVAAYVYEYKISVTPAKRRRRAGKKGPMKRHDIDKRLTGEFSVKEIAAYTKPLIVTGRSHLSHQRVYQYLEATSQFSEYRKNRRAYLKKNGRAA